MAQETQHVLLRKNETNLTSKRKPPDDKELSAEIISAFTAQPEIKQMSEITKVDTPRQTVKLTSPRLLHHHQIADFQKEIVEIDNNGSAQEGAKRS